MRSAPIPPVQHRSPTRMAWRSSTAPDDNTVGTSAGGPSSPVQANLISGNSSAGVNIDASLDFSQTFDTAVNQIVMNGFASVPNTSLELTGVSDSNYLTPQASSAFSLDRLDVASFSTTFEFQVQNPSIDGFTFTIQGQGSTALGLPGTNLGYGWMTPGGGPGIDQSVAIKFAVSSSQGALTSSTGLYIDGAAPTTPLTDLSGTGIDLSSGDRFQADLTFNGTTLSVTITDKQTGATATQSYPIDIPAVVEGPPPTLDSQPAPALPITSPPSRTSRAGPSRRRTRRPRATWSTAT